VAYYIEVQKGHKPKTTTGRQVADERLQRRHRRMEPEMREGLIERRLVEVLNNVEDVLCRRTMNMVEAVACV
jgi:hypothetical protein